MFERKERFGPEKKILLVVALAILIASVSSFPILYWMMNAALQEDIRSRAQVVNAYSEDNINVYSFTHINGPEDGRRDTYAEVRAMLENIRQIANVRYLYTAKLDASGRPVYLVDGLPPDAFAVVSFRIPRISGIPAISSRKTSFPCSKSACLESRLNPTGY